MITVMIVEDYARLRALYEQLLATDPVIHCVGEASGGEEALQLATKLRPDVLLLDISLPDANGLDIARRLKAIRPCAHVVILGEGDSEEYRAAAKAAGASAYLRKERTVEQLVPLIHGITGQPMSQAGLELS